MPYIKQEDRPQYEELIAGLVAKLKSLDVTATDGHLNYVVTSVMKRLYEPKYFNYNRAMGVLECIKQEFYARVISPYENLKAIENGEVQEPRRKSRLP